MKKLIPLYDASADIACSIDRAEVPGRIALIERLRSASTAIDRTEHGLLLHFPVVETIESDVRTFAVDEKACCSFWGFDVDASSEEITLQWDAPPTAAELIDRLHQFFLSDEPLTALDGLL
jgi:hypothetical protein